MQRPIGLGIWIAYLEKIDTNKLIEDCLGNNIKWIAIKSGNDNRFAVWPKIYAIIKACLSNGIQCFTWHYSYPWNIQCQIDQIRANQKDGVSGHIIDAEAEWCDIVYVNNAIRFVNTLKSITDFYIAHSPMDYMTYHPSFPWEQFNSLEGIMPQIYWTEHDQRGSKYHLENVMKIWKPWLPKVKPIGVTYGTPTIWGNPPGALTEPDLQYFTDYCSGFDSYSFYSYEAASAIFWNWLKQTRSHPIGSQLEFIDGTNVSS